MQAFRIIERDIWEKRQAHKKWRVGIIYQFTIKEIQLFLSRINKSGSCWTYSSKAKNYPSFHGYPVHRIAYELFINDIPKNMTIDHLCFNHFCVNPKHLEAVSLVENSRRYAYKHTSLAS